MTDGSLLPGMKGVHGNHFNNYRLIRRLSLSLGSSDRAGSKSLRQEETSEPCHRKK